MNYKEKEEIYTKVCFLTRPTWARQGAAPFLGQRPQSWVQCALGVAAVGRGVGSVVWNYAQSLEEVADRPSIMLRAGFLTITI